MTRAILEGTSKNKRVKSNHRNGLTKMGIRKQYERAKKEEKQYENEQQDAGKWRRETSFNHLVNMISPLLCFVDGTSQTLTNAAYCESCKHFMSRKVRTKPLRVLELFAGIGSGTVVL